ncbi:hypothetical protein TEA_025701 [Camellia sinensis var. sinensis]|uniref:Uncharacterized protein n=1 Tax=Camellia sinensis var. sinensis TaxID=542762 RepID=A0A4S4DP06_CAMSN|nr:hypothetical protein TEA_025701 [Camellia sinensis var. sinensis]
MLCYMDLGMRRYLEAMKHGSFEKYTVPVPGTYRRTVPCMVLLHTYQVVEMRRPGHYGDSGGNAYVTAQMQHMSGQRMEQKSGHYQGRSEPLTSDKEHPYGASKADGQWRWERDGSKVPNSMSPQMFNEGNLMVVDLHESVYLIYEAWVFQKTCHIRTGYLPAYSTSYGTSAYIPGQGGDTSRSYFQGQRQDSKMALERQGNNDPRSQPREEDMDIGFEDNPSSRTFEGLEQRFLDDIMKLSKEQTDAEDAENARHRERINTINAQYQEQLAALRARHSGRRDEFLRRESHARQQQYQQATMDHYPNSGMGPSDPHGYGGAAGSESHRTYNVDQYDSYRERARFLGSTRDHGFESRGPYPGGRVYDTGSRYY